VLPLSAATSISPVFTHKISAAVHTNITTAKSGAAISGPFITFSAKEPLHACSGNSIRLSTFYIEASVVIIFRRLISSKVTLNYLDLHDFLVLTPNKPLYSTGLARASILLQIHPLLEYHLK
jgi:hypothetical protein